MTDFFNNEEEKQEPEKIKLGDNEFSPEELQELVGAGQRLKDIETKNNQKIDDIVTSWGRRGNEIGEYKQKLEVAEAERKANETKTPEQLTEDQQKEAVIQEAKKYGLLTREEAKAMVEEVYTEKRSGERILSSVNKVLREAKAKGQPETDAESLLKFMADPSNPKDATKAYKIMFEKELDKWKEERLAKAKTGSGMINHNSQSTAGGKTFTPPTVTRQNLDSVLRDYISSKGE